LLRKQRKTLGGYFFSAAPCKSTLRVLRMLMHLISSHLGLLRGEFQTLKFPPRSDLRRHADSRWAMFQFFSFFLFQLGAHK